MVVSPRTRVLTKTVGQHATPKGRLIIYQSDKGFLTPWLIEITYHTLFFLFESSEHNIIDWLTFVGAKFIISDTNNNYLVYIMYRNGNLKSGEWLFWHGNQKITLGGAWQFWVSFLLGLLRTYTVKW